jgi:hypothetical protein
MWCTLILDGLMVSKNNFEREEIVMLLKENNSLLKSINEKLHKITVNTGSKY